MRDYNAKRYLVSARRNFFFYSSTSKVTKIYFLSFSNLELSVCAPVNFWCFTLMFTDFCVPSLNVAVQVMVTLPSALFLACNSESLSAFPSKSAVASAEEILQSKRH